MTGWCSQPVGILLKGQRPDRRDRIRQFFINLGEGLLVVWHLFSRPVVGCRRSYCPLCSHPRRAAQLNRKSYSENGSPAHAGLVHLFSVLKCWRRLSLLNLHRLRSLAARVQSGVHAPVWPCRKTLSYP